MSYHSRKLLLHLGSRTNRTKCTHSRQCSAHVETWLKASMTGDVKEMESILKNSNDDKLIHSRDKLGWTALMHSAKNGHLKSTEYLLESGSDVSRLNRTGQNAHELALLWRQVHVADLINSKAAKNVSSKLSVYFTHNPLNRHAHRRSDDMWLLQTMRQPETKYLLMHKCKPIVVPSKQGRLELYTQDIVECHNMIDDNRQNLIFLGVYDSELDTSNQISEEDTRHAYFAIEISDSDLESIQKVKPDAHALHVYPGVLKLSASDAALIGQARSLLDWHFRYSFCPTCGSSTTLSESGYKRICDDTTCLSHTGLYNTNYPRTDPSVITAVVSRDSERCLLGRKRSFPPGMYTCLAGFVEPGESVEMACIREVEEESGVRVDSVEYIASQPWPMPNALMLGCLSYTDTADKLHIDRTELEDARWFSRNDVINMLTRTHAQQLTVPPPQAIAHQLIKHWAIKTAKITI